MSVVLPAALADQVRDAAADSGDSCEQIVREGVELVIRARRERAAEERDRDRERRLAYETWLGRG
jgi:hypothetical protein